MTRNFVMAVAMASLLTHVVAGPVQADAGAHGARKIASPANAQPRIVGGSNVTISAFPSTVALLSNARLALGLENALFQAQNCGGTLISSTWVLTAAHCLVDGERVRAPSEVSILAGTTDLMAPVTSPTPVSQVIVHADYRNVIFGNDIALLQLSEPAPAPAIAMNSTKLPANEDTFIVGWGSTINLREDRSGIFPNILQGAIVPTKAGTECAALPGNYQFVNADIQICAGLTQGGIDTCSGDSGGPMYNITRDGQLNLAGITSWGDGCAIANQPGIYTDVAAYRGWIDEMMLNNGATRQETVVAETTTAIRSSSGGGGGATMLFIPLLMLFARFRTVKSTANYRIGIKNQPSAT